MVKILINAINVKKTIILCMIKIKTRQTTLNVYIKIQRIVWFQKTIYKVVDIAKSDIL